ncbi:PASTA domain-containing protein, partial [Microbacteriaceae bacterium K1510]|nr:PASTA domain-containing protein [Microbacteriaceae bacterium K1510]
MERRNEPKIQFPVDDEQTRVLPVITPDMLEQAQQERESLHSGRNGEDTNKQPKKKQWWIKAIAWIGAAGLFAILALFGLNLAQDLFRVPEVDVPHVEGSPLPVAEAKIKEAKLVPKIVEQFDSKLDIGMVISQDPRPPMRAKENSTVILYVS